MTDLKSQTKAPSTKHKVQSTKHQVQSTNLGLKTHQPTETNSWLIDEVLKAAAIIVEAVCKNRVLSLSKLLLGLYVTAGTVLTGSRITMPAP